MNTTAKKLPKHPVIKPMLATLVNKPFDSKEWLFEIKWDGYRAIAQIQQQEVELYSRNKKSFNQRYHPIVDDLKKLHTDAILDGEIVLLDKEGRPSFQSLQNYQQTQEGTLVYEVFDLLYLKGHDLRSFPLIQRKKLLKEILPTLPHIRYCDHLVGKGKEFFRKAQEWGLEGIIAKKAESSYQEQRSRDWLKIKSHHQQETIICGFTKGKGSREHFGSLLLGVYENKKLIYVGHTGSGFDQQSLKEIRHKMKPLIQSHSPFDQPPKTVDTTWIKPKLVCEIVFAEWTKEGLMRQAIFHGLRIDKKASEVTRELP